MTVAQIIAFALGISTVGLILYGLTYYLMSDDDED